MEHNNQFFRMESLAERLVFISMTNYMGGAENILLMMANKTNRPLIIIKRLFKSCLRLNKDQQVKYISKGWLLTGFLMLVKELYQYRKGYIIISTHPYLNAYLGFLKRVGFLESLIVVRECTSIFTRYTGLKRLSYKVAYKLGYPAVSLIICQTEFMRNQLLDHNRFIPKNRVIVLENPVDIDQVKEGANELIYDADLKGDFICAAGRLISEKGFAILINAFANIAKQNSSLKLLILGAGPERDNLVQLKMHLGLESRVILKGHVDNPFPYFKKAKLCVVSSIHEGFPNVLLQMMAVNKSVVSTLCAGGIEDIPSIIKVEVNNVPALYSAINSALSNGYKQEKISDYLVNRTPDVFLNSILRNVQKVNNYKRIKN